MSKSTWRCSFCWKASEEVQLMITGPAGNICSECVEICKEILDSEPKALEKQE